MDSTNILHMFALLNQLNMKTIRLIVLGICMIGLFHACRFSQRHTTIVEKSNNNYLKIEYSGNVSFNIAGTEISHISPDGYVKYSFNDKKLEAENNRMGGVKYELYDSNEKLNLDDNGRRFIAEAVQNMIKKGHNPGNGRY